MATQLDIEKIKVIIEKDKHLKNTFSQFLELLLLVEYNYEHIQQLETLIDLFKGGLSAYYKQYHPDQEFLCLQAGCIAENTRKNHYNRDGNKSPDVHSLYQELIGSTSSVKNFRQHYYKAAMSA